MPRLVFSDSDHLNIDIIDEQGDTLYTISTPQASEKVTTITKCLWSSSTCLRKTLAIIEWHSFKDDTILFRGDVIDASAMLVEQAWQTGRYFVGPDKKTYKWKISSDHCWLKPADDDGELARFHPGNRSSRTGSRLPYLDVSSTVEPMLDHIILTFIYVEKLRLDRSGESSTDNEANNPNSRHNQTNMMNMMMGF